jgi:hypothetical protein
MEDKPRGSRMSEKKKLLTTKILLIVLGASLGYFLNLAPDPLLHFLIYKDFSSELAGILVFVCVAVLLISIFGGKRPFGITRKRAYRILAMGISISSFVLAFITFLSYPSIIASTSHGWLVQTNFIIGGVSMGSLVFFVASILWDILIGSAFAILEHLLT